MKDQPKEQAPRKPKPITIERDDFRDRVIIEGVMFSGDYFRTMAHPSADYLYAIRVGDDGIIWLTEIHNAGEAEGFFFRKAYGGS